MRPASPSVAVFALAVRACAAQVDRSDAAADTQDAFADQGSIGSNPVPTPVACTPPAGATSRSFADCGVALPQGAFLGASCAHTDPPIMTGGAVTDGTYELVSVERFVHTMGTCPMPCDTPFAETLTFRGTGFTDSQRFLSDPDTIAFSSYTGTFATAGETITFTLMCANPTQSPTRYTARPDGIVFCGSAQCDYFRAR